MAAAPPGVFPVFVTGTTQDMFKIKPGTDLTEEMPYKRISVKDILKDISFRGVISDWQPAKAVIDKYRNGDTPPDQLEILVVMDEDSTYGQNYYICYTEEAAESVITAISAKYMQQSAGEGDGGAVADEKEEEEPRPKEIMDPDLINRPWIECEVQVC
jgi:hypothetical protein